MNIRVAIEADVAEIQRVRMSVLENVLRDPASVQPEDVRRMVTVHGRGWVCEIAGRVVGFAIADQTRMNVWALFVEPAHEGRGIGRRLHDTLLDWMMESGASRVWLSTDPDTRAERFYRTAGWEDAGREANGETRFEMSREQWLTMRSR